MSKRGENIYKRKDGRWEGRYVKGRENGKIKYGYVYAKTYREVKEKLCSIHKLLIEKEEKLPVKSEEMSFEKIAIEWFHMVKPQLRESSIVKYSNILTKYLLPRFGGKRIQSITREEIIEFRNELLLCGGQKRYGLSPKTVTSIISVLKNIFEYAIQFEKLDVICIDHLSVKQVQKPMRILSRAEQQRLNQYLCENRNLTNLGILVCLYTGIRIGEVCALKWEDISFQERYLYVHRTMQRIQKKGENGEKTSISISSPKSDCSIRRIPLSDEIFRLLLEARCQEDTYLLTGFTNIFVEPRTLQNRFKAVIRECGMENINFHVLRHTFATRCVELGFDMKSLSEILGHASVNITLNRYVHPSMEQKQKNMNRLSELFAVK